MTTMISKYLFILSLYCLAIGGFVSVSFLGAYQALIALAFLLTLTPTNIKKFKQLNIPTSTWALIAYITTLLLSLFINFDTITHINKSLSFIHTPIVALMALSLLSIYKNDSQTKKHIIYASSLFVCTIIITFLISAIRHFWGFDLITMANGNFGERMYGFSGIMKYGYGTGMIVLLLLSILIMIWKTNLNFLKYLLLTSIICGLMGVYFAYTRGALLGILIAGPVLIAIYNKNLGKVLATITLITIAAMVAASFIGVKSNNRLVQKSNSASNTIRISQFKAALYMAKESPLLGHGPIEYTYIVKDIKNKYAIEHPDFYNSHAHNLFLETLANAGLLGLISLLSWLALWINEVRKSLETSLLFMPVIIYTIISGQFEMLMPPTMIMFLFIYAIDKSQIITTYNPNIKPKS